MLHDCKENQKLTAKLSDWAVTHWSRKVSDHLDNTQEYPKFVDFVEFVEKEMRVACQAVVSLSAVRGSDILGEHKYQNPREVKQKTGHRTLTTDKIKCAENSVSVPVKTSAKGKPQKEKPNTNPGQPEAKSCPFCHEDHYLPSCPGFTKKSIQDRYDMIQAQKRCFGYLRTAHGVKWCVRTEVFGSEIYRFTRLSTNSLLTITMPRNMVTRGEVREDRENCKTCKKRVRSEDNGMECNACGWWYHAGCQGVPLRFLQHAQ